MIQRGFKVSPRVWSRSPPVWLSGRDYRGSTRCGIGRRRSSPPRRRAPSARDLRGCTPDTCWRSWGWILGTASTFVMGLSWSPYTRCVQGVLETVHLRRMSARGARELRRRRSRDETRTQRRRLRGFQPGGPHDETVVAPVHLDLLVRKSHQPCRLSAFGASQVRHTTPECKS